MGGMESLYLLTLQMGMRQVGGRHVERKVPGKREGGGAGLSPGICGKFGDRGF